MTRLCVAITVSGALAVVSGAISACSSGSARAESRPSATIITADTQPAPAPGVLPRPPVVSAEDGLEVHSWLADDTRSAVGRALAQYSEYHVLPAALDAAWNESGLRVVRAPVSDLGTLERTLTPIRPLRKQWVGWTYDWSEIVRARRTGDGAVVLAEGRSLTLPRGMFRVLCRAWDAPAVEGSATLRLELAVQHRRDDTFDASDALRPPSVRPSAREGQVFGALTWEGVLEPGYVYVITSMPPGAAWPSADGARRGDAAAEGRGNPASPTAMDLSSFGPPAAGVRPIGEAMLAAEARETGSVDAKLVVVLIPRVPARYRLLP